MIGIDATIKFAIKIMLYNQLINSIPLWKVRMYIVCHHVLRGKWAYWSRREKPVRDSPARVATYTNLIGKRRHQSDRTVPLDDYQNDKREKGMQQWLIPVSPFE